MAKVDLNASLVEYRASLKAQELDRWLANFADGATVEDPVGGPVLTGTDQLTGLFKGLGKTFSAVEMNEEFTVVTKLEAVVKWTLNASTATGLNVSFSGVSMYKFNEDGKITQMRAFWDPKELARQFK